MAAEKVPPRRLGRGLDALLGKTVSPAHSASAPPSPGAGEETLRQLQIATIRANRYQPRKVFDPTELQELQSSIKATGLLQPITVRQLQSNEGYELVAGERRLRAVRELGWDTIPAIVRNYDDRTMLTLALVENLQRDNLNPIEEAEGYARLVKEFGLTQQEIADLVGRDRSTISNLLRVLNLPIEVRQMLEQGVLTVGHARALLGIDDTNRIHTIAKEIIENDLSVRSIEHKVREETPKPKSKGGRPKRQKDRPPEVRQVEDMLRSKLQTDVAVEVKGEERGEIKLQFYSYDDLNRLLELMGCGLE